MVKNYHFNLVPLKPLGILFFSSSKKPQWKRLNGGTVPPYKMHHGGTVPPYKMHHGGTVPPYKMHRGGTLPKMFPRSHHTSSILRLG